MSDMETEQGHSEGWAQGWYDDVRILRGAVEGALEELRRGEVGRAADRLADALRKVGPLD